MTSVEKPDLRLVGAMSLLLPTKTSAGGELRLTYRDQTKVRTKSSHGFQWAGWLACAKREMQTVSEGYLLEMKLRITYFNPEDETADIQLVSALQDWMRISAFTRLPRYAVYLIDTPLTHEPPYFGEHSFFNRVRISMLERLVRGSDEKFDVFQAGLMTTVTREPPQLDENDEPVRGGMFNIQSTAAFIVNGVGALLKKKMPLPMACFLNGKDLDGAGFLKQTIETERGERPVRS